MPSEGKIQKVDILYLLSDVLAPVLVLVGGVILAVCLPERAGLAISMITFFLAVLWWAFLGRKVYETIRDKRLKELQSSGFVPNHTFNADGCTVVVDLVHGQVALLFRWNPSKVYVRPASTLSGIHVNDGRSGRGVMAGSSRVSFLFTVEGIRVRVNTFTSNRRWRMDSDHILTGISKADTMVKALTAAGARVH